MKEGGKEGWGREGRYNEEGGRERWRERFCRMDEC